MQLGVVLKRHHFNILLIPFGSASQVSLWVINPFVMGTRRPRFYFSALVMNLINVTDTFCEPG
jgi:hypothetical protein